MQLRTLVRLSHHVDPERLAPHYLTSRDEAWVEVLLQEHALFAGRRRSELHERLREPLRVAAPSAKLELAVEVLDGLSRNRTNASVPPKEARLRTFMAAAKNPSRTLALDEAAASLGVAPSMVEAALFADLRGERRISPLPEWLTAASLILEANLALVAAFLRRAASVCVTTRGDAAGALLRHARRAGLIGIPYRLPDDRLALEVSGPFSLFRHTSVYARALASVLLRATRCSEFELSARCVLGAGPRLSTIVVRSGDPIAASRDLTDFDTRVEDRFIRDFARLASEWELEAVPATFEEEGQLVLPDFTMTCRERLEYRCFVEIVGFWTREYLRRKLERRAVGGAPLLICVDVQRQCGEDDLPSHPSILPYKKRLDAALVLRAVNRLVGRLDAG